MVIIIDDEEIYEVEETEDLEEEVTEDLEEEVTEVTETEPALVRFEKTRKEIQLIQETELSLKRQQKLEEMKGDFKVLLSREVTAINTRLMMIQALMEKM